MRFARIFAGLTAEGRRNGVGQLKLVIFHLMYRHFWDMLRYVMTRCFCVVAELFVTQRDVIVATLWTFLMCTYPFTDV